MKGLQYTDFQIPRIGHSITKEHIPMNLWLKSSQSYDVYLWPLCFWGTFMSSQQSHGTLVVTYYVTKPKSYAFQISLHIHCRSIWWLRTNGATGNMTSLRQSQVSDVPVSYTIWRINYKWWSRSSPYLVDLKAKFLENYDLEITLINPLFIGDVCVKFDSSGHRQVGFSQPGTDTGPLYQPTPLTCSGIRTYDLEQRCQSLFGDDSYLDLFWKSCQSEQ